jgi:adenylate cyclase
MLAHTTALAERLGVAAFQPLVQTFHTLAQECVQRYEGTAQPLGEAGMLALFGVPMAQEDHAWRAVQAALALQQRLQEGHCGAETLLAEALSAGVGVHTGWVVAGSGSVEPPQAVVIGGDTVQGTMRLQALAEPGTILVSDATLQLLRGAMRSEAYGLVRIPGHATPLMTYTVLGMEPQPGTRVRSPFVGHQRELDALDDLLARALARARWSALSASPGWANRGSWRNSGNVSRAGR